MTNDITAPNPDTPGMPHPKFQCPECKIIDTQLSPEQVMTAVVADAEHWGVDWAEEKRGIYGVEAMLSANKVMTGRAMRGDLTTVRNPAGFYMIVMKRYGDQLSGLKRSRK
jgi:hypothetical protein